MAVTTTSGGGEPAGVGTEAGLGAPVRSAAAAEALLLELVQRHADELLRVARRHSLCLDDAHDAYQRSLEQFLRHGRRLRRETAHRWLFTVCRREALAVRRARGELVGAAEGMLDRLEALHDESPEERALATDAVTRSAEALQALKPQEVRALWLQADGRSYVEIQAATGWSYTKVNRCIREGKRAFLARRAELETGAACRPWGGLLAAVAGGEAGAEELSALRPHLARCGACRATLRALHDSGVAMATVLPPGLVGVAGVEAHGHSERLDALGRWVARAYEVLSGPVQERAVGGMVKAQAAVEAASAGKLAAVAASTAALAGGGGALVAEPLPVGAEAQQTRATARRVVARRPPVIRPSSAWTPVLATVAPAAAAVPASVGVAASTQVAPATTEHRAGDGVPEFSNAAAGSAEFDHAPRTDAAGSTPSSTTSPRARSVVVGEFGSSPDRARPTTAGMPTGSAAAKRTDAPAPARTSGPSSQRGPAVTPGTPPPSGPAAAEFGP